MFYKIFIIFTLVLYCAACSSSNSLDDPMPIDVGDEFVQERLIEKLEAEKIHFEIINPTGLLVEQQDIQMVLFYSNQIMNNLVPMDRSISLAPPYRSRLVRLLEENDIRYEEIRAFNGIWIIWEESDAETVEDLIEHVMGP